MRNWIRLPLMLALVGLWAVAAAVESKPASPAPKKEKAAQETTAKPANEIHWLHDYDAAMAEAKKTGKPVMIDFYTDWCHWCKVLDKKTYTDPKVVNAADKLLAVKINAEKSPKLAQKFNVDSYPRIVFLSSEGKEIYQIKGYEPPDQFLPDMKAALKGKSPKDLVKDLVKNGTDDPEEQKWVGMNLIDEGKADKALPWLQKAEAKLPDGEKVSIQKVLPFLYLKNNQKDKAEKAFDALKSNPKADPEEVAETNIRFSYMIKDKERMRKALDRLASITKSDAKKAQVLKLKNDLDKLFQEAQANTGSSNDTSKTGDAEKKE